MVLTIHYLMQHYRLVIQEGYAGLGDWRLRRSFAFASIDKEDMQLPAGRYNPSKIVDLIKRGQL